MATLSVRGILSKCLRKSGRISLKDDVFSIRGHQSHHSLKDELKFIREFHCPPRAPTNLRIIDLTENTISLAWDDHADNEEGFEIRWRGRKVAHQHDDGSHKLHSPNRESFTLTGLFPGYEYCIKVKAFNKGGDSNFSSEVCHTLPESPQVPQSFSQVAFNNCHVERRTLHFWRRDLTSGSSWTEQGSLPAQYTDNGSCPSGASPLVISLPEEHLYEIVAVDPDALNCGGNNDPEITSCRRHGSRYIFMGNPSGFPITFRVD